jgi:uncharacterized protein (DUF2267 family)
VGVPQACVHDRRAGARWRTKYYEDVIRVLEAVGAHASHVDKKTARRALQFTTQVLRNLFEIPSSGGGS